MQGVSPHVAACQWFIVWEDHRVVLGIGLVAALSDPAGVVRERVMEAPATNQGDGSPPVDNLSWPQPAANPGQGLFTQSQTISLTSNPAKDVKRPIRDSSLPGRVGQPRVWAQGAQGVGFGPLPRIVMVNTIPHI